MAIIHINTENFKEAALESEKPVLVDFFATWCGPCKMLSPILDQVEQEMGEKVVIAKVDIDESMDLAKEYGIMGVPTLILFKNGAEVTRVSGFRQKSQIEDLINSNLD